MWMRQILERNRDFQPTRIAVADQRTAVTWAAFDRRVRNLAGGLLGRGIRPGDRVAVLSHDRVEVLETYFALALIGAPFVPVNHSLRPDEIVDITARTRVVQVIGERALVERGALDLPRLCYEDDAYQDCVDREFSGTLPEVHYDDVLALLHTSATTGRPKAVVLSHRSLMHVSLGWLAAARPGPDAVLLNCCPLFHGSFGTSITHLAAGATVVLLPGFTPQGFLRAVEQHGVTHAWVVPEMLSFLTRTAATARADLSSLEEVIYGAAPMPYEVYRKAALALKCGFRQVWGMTEAGGSLATLGPEEHPDPNVAPSGPIPTGRMVPGLSVGVFSEDGAELPTGAVGEVCVRGDDLMRGYWDDPAATAETMRDGWLRTGDLGRLDDRGYLYLTDRLKDVVIRGGQNVYPAEIERVLRTHRQVLDAAVVGVPDPDWGQVPLAFVVPDTGDMPTQESLLELLAEELAPYKRPGAIRFIDSLPRNAAGKILKRVLRETAGATDSSGGLQ